MSCFSTISPFIPSSVRMDQIYKREVQPLFEFNREDTEESSFIQSTINKMLESKLAQRLIGEIIEIDNTVRFSIQSKHEPSFFCLDIRPEPISFDQFNRQTVMLSTANTYIVKPGLKTSSPGISPETLPSEAQLFNFLVRYFIALREGTTKYDQWKSASPTTPQKYENFLDELVTKTYPTFNEHAFCRELKLPIRTTYKLSLLPPYSLTSLNTKADKITYFQYVISLGSLEDAKAVAKDFSAKELSAILKKFETSAQHTNSFDYIKYENTYNCILHFIVENNWDVKDFSIMYDLQQLYQASLKNFKEKTLQELPEKPTYTKKYLKQRRDAMLALKLTNHITKSREDLEKRSIRIKDIFTQKV